MTTQLSQHFTLEELVFSETAGRLGIDNTPSSALISHAKLFLIPGIERVRGLLNRPMRVSSGYRSERLNVVVPGSSNTSQHTKFEAIDFTCPEFGSVLVVAKYIISSGIAFDQLIYEYGSWIHISFSSTPKVQVLSKYAGTPYLKGLVDKDGKPL